MEYIFINRKLYNKLRNFGGGRIIIPKMTRKMVGLFLVELILIVSFGRINSVQGIEYRETLAFGEYFAVIPDRKISDKGSINWSFSGNNEYVDITVWILDGENYAIFQNGSYSVVGYEVSDGTTYEDSGIWIPTFKEKWHIVFFHNDDDIHMTTTLTINVIFDYGGLAVWLLTIIIALPSSLAVIGLAVLVAFLITRKKKQSRIESQRITIEEVNSE
ncbi:MAG: hypothetical protein HZR80_19560 [Candidatus Heimdallarchaeota archaeon]